MRKRWLGLMLLMTLLQGCVTPGKRGGDVAQAVYDLNAPDRKPAALRSPAVSLEVRAPAWLDGPGIDYRLAYADPSRLREYALARWAGPPAQLIQWRLMRDLGFSAHGQVQTRCLVRLELETFAQVFETAQQSSGLLRARLQWLDRQRTVLDEQWIEISEAAPSADVAGGVFALRATVDRLAGQIAARERESGAALRLKSCAG